MKNDEGEKLLKAAAADPRIKAAVIAMSVAFDEMGYTEFGPPQEAARPAPQAGTPGTSAPTRDPK